MAVIGDYNIVKCHYIEDATRRVTSGSSDITIFSTSFTKEYSATKLWVTAIVPTWNNSTNGGTYMFLQMSDGTNTLRQQRGMSRPYMTEGESGTFSINTRFGTTFNSGTINMYVGWDTYNNGVNRPFVVMNPNNSDDGRNPQNATHYFIYEVNE
tara:strand:+ start:40 stop:501 length:462 start_codon:yes stop_codon:yes gene_type:complete